MTGTRDHNDSGGSLPSDTPPTSVADARRAARVAEIRKKAERMAYARQHPPSLWRHLTHMGTLGWLFVLPAVGFSAAGHFLSTHYAIKALGPLGILIGIATGTYLVFRNIQKSLLEQHDSEEER